MKEPALTAAVSRGIVAAIRAGAFPQVAAAAHGIDAALWERWLRRGRGRRAREPFRNLVKKVEEALAQARLRAEMAVLDKDARTWLKHGPGRDLVGKPGWAALVRAAPPPSDKGTDLAALPEFLQFLADIRIALAPFPEALAAVIRVVEALGQEKKPNVAERHPVSRTTDMERDAARGHNEPTKGGPP
jgi:hypothetical protein